MVLCRDYNEEKRLDRVWYNSSSIVYSECEDKLNDYKTLRVTFKNGSTYQYNKVDVNDYAMFVHGGIDGSNGKALNKFIKPKCEFEKLENRDLKELDDEMQLILEKKKQEKSKLED